MGPQAVWTVRETMSHWLNSDEHRSILLIPSFTEVGIGVVTGRFQGRAGTAAWVVHFGCHHALHAAARAAGDSIYQQLVDATGSNYGGGIGATAVQLAGSGL